MRVPIEQLIDPSRDRPATRRELQAALPRGWVLDPDGSSAHRDVRLMFRQGWILVCGLAVFGAAGLGLFWHVFPAGWAGVARFALLLGLLIAIGGVVAPIISRALYRRSAAGAAAPARRPPRRTGPDRRRNRGFDAS